MNKVISREYVEKNYIHKDKIIDLLNFIKSEMEKDEIDEFGFHSMEWATLDYMSDLIKEKLLEDTKDEQIQEQKNNN